MAAAARAAALSAAWLLASLRRCEGAIPPLMTVDDKANAMPEYMEDFTWPPAPARRAVLLAHLSRQLVNADIRKDWDKAVADGEVEKRLDRSRKLYRLPTKASPKEERICMTVAFFKEAYHAFNVLSDERLSAFIESCLEQYPKLDKRVTNRLEKALVDNRLHTKLWENYGPTPTVTSDSCAVGFDQKNFWNLSTELGGQDAGRYNVKGVRPLQERHVKIKEIRDVFEHGEVARFDARQILPEWMFGITIQQIRDMHKDIAHKVPVNMGIHFGMSARCHDALINLTNRMPTWMYGPNSDLVQLSVRALIPWLMDNVCEDFPSLDQLAQWAVHFRDEPYMWNNTDHVKKEVWDDFHKDAKLNRTIPSSEINTRRLPTFESYMNFAVKLGMENDVLHTHGFLWFGTAAGQHHIDPGDNILMQLTGTVDVIVFNSMCLGLLDRPDGLIFKINDGILPWATDGQADGKVRAPWFHLRLREGEGVVVPSGSVHKVVTRNTKRVGLNAFFEPKFGKMWWKHAPGNCYNRNDKDVLASRSLWVQSLGHLWDTKQIGMGFHTVRMEVI